MEPLFRSLGVLRSVRRANFLRHPGLFIQSRFHSVFVPYGADKHGPWLGYQADRTTLNEVLLNRALACGALVRRGEKVIRPILKAGNVEGVVTDAGSYLSRFVIDAAGHRQWLIRALGIPSIRVSPPLLAHYGWVKSSESPEDNIAVPNFHMVGPAWEWSAPLSSNLHAWVKLDLSDRFLRHRPCPPSYLADCTPLGKAGACDVTWKIARPCAGPGYYMVGDAAWVLDPASSHGVLKAIISARAACEAIANSFSGSSDPYEQQMRYRAWMEDWFSRDAAALISLYSEVEHPVSWLSAASEVVRKIAIRSSTQATSTTRTIS
jgi:flavin-dependent dehydrogenase